MIDDLHLSHFKCFDKLDLPLGKLTLLTGRNATGKSSVIQSLLLLHQGLIGQGQSTRIPLNGDIVNLGCFADVMDVRSGRTSFSIGATSGSYRVDWTFSSEDKGALVAPLVKACDSKGWSKTSDEGVEIYAPISDHASPTEEAVFLLGDIENLLHISTERIGPRETYSADPVGDEQLGPRGEYTAWFLHRNGEREVAACLRRPNVPPTLIRQTEGWLDHFFPGVAFEVERIKGTNLLSLRFRTSEKDRFYRPSNVGFGLSHLLPVLVGGLGVKAGEMLVVENPEAHLHPSAQAEIGRFLSMVAAAGAQVVIETHSDHVLNGVRLAIKGEVLEAEDARIHYFDTRDSKSRLVSPNVRCDGTLDRWPTGFFDQLERDLDQLTVW